MKRQFAPSRAGGLRAAGAAIAAALAALPAAHAVELSYSGFGTLGAAVSDRSYHYQRFISDDASLRRDSLAGVQADVAFTNEIGLTVQGKVAPDTNDDDHYAASLAWAFASWRPTNEWLVRAGKWRVPLNLYSEAADVGTTYDFARLPPEMYSLNPSTDAVGLFVSRSWNVEDGEFALEGYAGKRKNDVRIWVRDDSALYDSGAQFLSLKYRLFGLVLSYRDADSFFRVGVHATRISNDAGHFVTDYPFVRIAPGIGYYQIGQAGPNVQTKEHLHATTLRAGADIGLPASFRAVGEVQLTLPFQADAAVTSTRAYVALLRRFGSWTPYISAATIRSSADRLDKYDAVNGNQVPASVPNAAKINATQRIGADVLRVYDQSSFALGSSYAFSEKVKLKGEVLTTRVGRVSQFVDAPAGGDIRRTNINVLSLSISAVF